MNPRLVVIAGPLKGTVLSLTAETKVTIGRDPSNNLAVADRLLSRRHCLINWESGHFSVKDLNSSNGTYVNGVEVAAAGRPLEHGDHIAAGGSQVVFLTDDEEGSGSSSGDEGGDGSGPLQYQVHLDERDFVARSTIRLRVDDALYLRPEKAPESLPPLARMARDLTVLLKISTTINSIRDPEILERQLLEFIFEVVPAERGAILLSDHHREDLTAVCGWGRTAGPEHPIVVSRTIARQVLSDGTAILSNDVLADEELADTASLISARVHSLLCVPLVLFGRVTGVIYLSTTDRATRFTEDHLQLSMVIAGIAAVALENARHIERLESENRRLRDDIRIEHNMIGESPRMRDIYQLIARLASTDSTVLIRGESGTGKELAAHALHHNSPRAAKPFVAINCAALTETLLESELFGHEKGAFTGAVGQKRGKLEIADGGTVFLDEVGELAPVLQAKLLRVLQEREFERVGGTRPLRVDIRVIAATNRDLETAITTGGFRQDLYYRLNVVSFEMPPLQERREDVPLLAEFFAAKYSRKFKRRIAGISTAAVAYLTAYDWPGNVRELENAIERAVVLGSTEYILPEDLPEMIVEAAHGTGVGPAAKYHEAIREAKRQLIVKAVEGAGGSYTEAAKLLDVHPNYLHRLIRNLDLKSALKRPSNPDN